MCRNIRPLYNFAPPATEDEVRSSAVQFRPQGERFSATFGGQ
jgi:hypothetical protein